MMMVLLMKFYYCFRFFETNIETNYNDVLVSLELRDKAIFVRPYLAH